MNVNKLFSLIFVCFFCANSLWSQFLSNYYDTLSLKQEVIIDGNIEYFSSGIEKDIISKFYRGGFVSSEMKNSSYDKHSGVNRFGGLAQGDIEYRNYNLNLFKKKSWGLVVKGGYGSIGSALYSKDAFGMVMYGNERYRGETIDLSGSNMTFVSYQKIGVGFIDPVSKSNVSLNFYNISDRFYGHFRDVEITQDLLGDTLNFMLKGEFSSKQNKKFNQGFGIGFDLDFTLPITYGQEKTAFIQFQMENVGFGYLYEKQKVYNVDSSFSFAGFQLSDLIGDDVIFNDSNNVMDTLGIRSTEKTKTFMLPGFIQIGKIIDAASVKKIQSFYGLRLYPTLIYSPFVYAGIDYHPSKWINIGASASYGGFGKFKGGLYSSIRFSNYSIGIGTENIVGFFSKKAMGESILIKLRWAI